MTHLDLIFDNVWRCCCKQGRSTAFRHWVLHERSYSAHADLTKRAVRFNSLILLIRHHTSGVCCVDPRQTQTVCDLSKVARLDVGIEFAKEEDLSQFGSVVELGSTDILVDLVD